MQTFFTYRHYSKDITSCPGILSKEFSLSDAATLSAIPFLKVGAFSDATSSTLDKILLNMLLPFKPLITDLISRPFCKKI